MTGAVRQTKPGETHGYIGLGNMGSAMVANMLGAGLNVLAYDKAGTPERAPGGARLAGSTQEIACAVTNVFICVPDGPASSDVVEAIEKTPQRQVKTIINLSTTGIAAAENIAAELEGSGISYVDAPVSGGQTGAIRGTITVMWSGSEHLLNELKPVLETFARSVFFIGGKPGQGQALKLLNNYLSAVAMTATSEAMVFGEAMGLDMQTMLDVVNVSTGQNTATSDKFPNRIVTGTYDAGFRMALMEKDLALYLEAVRAARSPEKLGSVVADYWRKGISKYPGGDSTDIFKLIRDGES